ncbi:MAG: NAD(P)H-hydrate dehydratase [Calditrichaeota bacterium]|nr:MAG: NAD(P)H-hydrate dehydratase [Calditrichota bacterium]
MLELITPKQSQKIDKLTIELGIEDSVLMEIAAKSIFDLIKSKFKNLENKTVYVFCGKGNNGGDGFVVARWLQNYKANVLVLLLNSEDEIQGLPKKKLELYKKAGGKVLSEISKNDLEILENPDFVVDALYGTGFRGELRGIASQAVKKVNSFQTKVFAVDIPSGLNGANGMAKGEVVKADFTVTFGKIKTGLYINSAQEFTGKITAVDIGFLPEAEEKVGFEAKLVTKEAICKILPKRKKTDYKNSVGKVFVWAGSEGMTGAGILASKVTLVAGAGLTTLAVPQNLNTIFEENLTEVMTFPFEFSTKTLTDFKEKINWSDVCLFGPGLGASKATRNLFLKILAELKRSEKLCVLDADALNLLAEKSDFSLLPRNAILTPHLGEFARLTKLTKTEICENILDVGKDFSKKHSVVLVLKGAPTVTFCGSEAFVNSTGNSGMATAGSGDVLSGIIASLLSQTKKPLEAAINGVFLHGLSGDLATKNKTEFALTASDLIDFLPKAFKKIRKI